MLSGISTFLTVYFTLSHRTPAGNKCATSFNINSILSVHLCLGIPSCFLTSGNKGQKIKNKFSPYLLKVCGGSGGVAARILILGGWLSCVFILLEGLFEIQEKIICRFSMSYDHQIKFLREEFWPDTEKKIYRYFIENPFQLIRLCLLDQWVKWPSGGSFENRAAICVSNW